MSINPLRSGFNFQFQAKDTTPAQESPLNPIAQVPRGEATPIKRFCYSKDFEKDW